MDCPSCGHGVDARAAACRACGAPFALTDEPEPAPLDRALDLDRAARWSLTWPPVLSWNTGHGQVAAVMAPAQLRTTWRGQLPAEESAEEPLSAGTETAAPIRAVPVWRRLAAAGIDSLLVSLAAGIPLGLVARALPPGSRSGMVVPACIAFVALVGFTYCWLGHALMSATIGKRCLALRVAGPEGEPPGLGRSAARAAIAMAGLAALGPGALVGLFTLSGRTLHDLATGTRVVRDDP